MENTDLLLTDLATQFQDLQNRILALELTNTSHKAGKFRVSPAVDYFTAVDQMLNELDPIPEMEIDLLLDDE